MHSYKTVTNLFASVHQGIKSCQFNSIATTVLNLNFKGVPVKFVWALQMVVKLIEHYTW